MAIFDIWISAPFVGLSWAMTASRQWSNTIQIALCRTTILVALGSLAVYGYDAWRPRAAQAACVYVVTPPAPVLLIMAILAVVMLASKRQTPRI